MKGKMRIAAAVTAALLLAAGSSFAHHSFGGVFDANKVVNISGVIAKFDRVNPHSIMYVDAKGENGEVEHWALEGPSVNGLNRRGLDKVAAFKAGEMIEACGYGTRDGINPLKSDSTKNVSIRFISAELLTLPNGEKVVWSNYGQRKCLDPQ
jgi:hypothetical protein